MNIIEYVEKFYNTNLKKENKLTYDKAFMYWRERLCEKCMYIFKWDGLPEEIEQKEIEYPLIFFGYGGFLKDGKYLSCRVGLHGVTDYPDEFTTMIYATPLHNGSRKIGVNSVLISNDSNRTALIELVDYYAHMLAHASLTFQSVLINCRATAMIGVSNSLEEDSVKAYYNALEDGKSAVVQDSESLNSFLGSENIKKISDMMINTSSLRDCYDCTDLLLKSFYSDIGVSKQGTKRERLITSEVNEDNEYRLFNIWDMLECRKKACEQINKIFGLNMSVEISNEWKGDVFNESI